MTTDVGRATELSDRNEGGASQHRSRACFAIAASPGVIGSTVGGKRASVEAACHEVRKAMKEVKGSTTTWQSEA